MEWIKEILENSKEENVDETVERIKQEFPKHAVPKEQYNKKAGKVEELESELNTAKEQLEQTNSQLDELSEKSENNDELKQNLEEIKSEYEEYKQQEETRLNQIKKKSTLEKQLLKSNANQDAVDLLLNDFDLDSLKLDEENNLKNFDEQLEKVREKRPTLFGEVAIEGNTPPDGEGSDDLLINVDSLDNLTEQQINDNWEQVSKVLSQNKK